MDLRQFRPLVPPRGRVMGVSHSSKHMPEGGGRRRCISCSSWFQSHVFKLKYIMTLPSRKHTLPRSLSTSAYTSPCSAGKLLRGRSSDRSHTFLSSSETLSLMTPLPWTNSGLPAVPAGNVTPFLSHLKEHIGLHMSERDSILLLKKRVSFVSFSLRIPLTLIALCHTWSYAAYLTIRVYLIHYI